MRRHHPPLLLTGLLFALAIPLTGGESTDGRALVASIQRGNHNLLVSLLRNGADPNAASLDDSITPLEAAVGTNAVDTIDLLLHSGADPNRATRFGVTPLMFAAGEGKLEAVRHLLAGGAHVNSRSMYGTALSDAVAQRKVEVVEALLAAGADVPTDFTSPLLRAVEGHDQAIVRALLRFKADPDVHLSGKSSPLALAIEQGDDEIARLLLAAGAKPDSKAADGFPAVFVSSRMGKKELTGLLIGRGAPRRAALRGALLRGAETGDVNLVRDALDRGISVDTPDRTKQAALAVAARNGQLSTVELLIRRHAQVDHIDGETRTALMEAAAGDRPQIIKLLLRRHASINAQDYLGRTALIMASEADAVSAVQTLLDAFADANINSLGGGLSDVSEPGVGTALHVALRERHNTIVRLLLDSGAEAITGEPWLVPSAVDVAIKAGNLDGLQMIVAACPSLLQNSNVEIEVEAALRPRSTTVGLPLRSTTAQVKASTNFLDPFMKVIESQSIQSIEEALPRYRDRINERDSHGFAPLIVAISIGIPQIVDLLIRNGADVNQAQGEFTPLESAIDRAGSFRFDDERDPSLIPRIEIVQRLLNAGASTAVQTGHSLMFGAKCVPVMRLLIENGVPLKKSDLNQLLVFKMLHDGHPTLIDFLVGEGADPNFNNGEPLATAVSALNPLAVKTLLRLGADPNRGSALRSALSSTEILDLLVAAGARADSAKGDHQESLIVSATRHGSEVLHTLLKAKVDLNARGSGGQTALHVTVETKDRASAEVLLRAGADANIRNDAGETPLIQAAMDGAIDLVELLLAHGADPSLRDRKGRNAMDWAGANHYDATVSLLRAGR